MAKAGISPTVAYLKCTKQVPVARHYGRVKAYAINPKSRRLDIINGIMGDLKNMFNA